MGRVKKDTSSEFWDEIKKSADTVRRKPDWMHAGINLNEKNFETFKPKEIKQSMKATKKKKTVPLVPNKTLQEIAVLLSEQGLWFELDIRDVFEDYFSDLYAKSYKGKKMPTDTQLIKLILENGKFKKAVEESVSFAVSEIMFALQETEENYLTMERLDAAALKRDTEQKAAKEELMKSLSKEQRKALKELYNIGV